MNRKERRSRKLPEKEPVYYLKKSQLDQIKQETMEKAIEEAFLLMVAIPVKVMHDKYGWRMFKRLPEFAEAITDEYQSFSEGELSAEEYREFVFEHCGLKFQRNE